MIATNDPEVGFVYRYLLAVVCRQTPLQRPKQLLMCVHPSNPKLACTRKYCNESKAVKSMIESNRDNVERVYLVLAWRAGQS
jgi:hypothetical protein